MEEDWEGHFLAFSWIDFISTVHECSSDCLDLVFLGIIFLLDAVCLGQGWSNPAVVCLSCIL